MSKKPIIVFEGIEGSGKSHHISIISKYLKNNKIDFLKIREPGGNPNSEKIRKIILSKYSRNYSSKRKSKTNKKDYIEGEYEDVEDKDGK